MRVPPMDGTIAVWANTVAAIDAGDATVNTIFGDPTTGTGGSKGAIATGFAANLEDSTACFGADLDTFASTFAADLDIVFGFPGVGFPGVDTTDAGGDPGSVSNTTDAGGDPGSVSTTDAFGDSGAIPTTPPPTISETAGAVNVTLPADPLGVFGAVTGH
jgi:hypothetical protein